MSDKNTAEHNKAKNHSHRTSGENRADAFNVLAWLAEGAAGIASELKQSDLGLGQEFWTHSHNARREGLLAARALLDRIIERSEQETAREAEQEQRRERRGKISIG